MLKHLLLLYKHQYIYGPFVKADGGMLFSYQNLGEKRFKTCRKCKCSPVALLEDLKLLAKEASEGGTYNCP